jgi:polyhydroxyalkanoate synthesis regulator phasin
MRVISAVLFAPLFLGAPLAHAGEKELFDKFKRQNEQGREKLKEDINLVLEKSLALEKDDPAKALLLLQTTRDLMLQKGLLTAREDRALAEPLWERVQMLRGVIQGKEADELRTAVADYKEYLSRMNEEFANLRQALLLPNREVPPGGPAFLQFINGTQAAGWLNEAPDFVVNITVNDQSQTHGPGVVAGLHTPQGFYLYQPVAKRFVFLSKAEFFLAAMASHPPARKTGFWMPSEIPPPPPGFYKNSTGAVGAALFARAPGTLMTAWAGPGGTTPETVGAGGANDSATARLYRNVLVDIMVQEGFANLKKVDQNRFRDVILTFLERRSRDGMLNSEEAAQLADLLADIYPDRRAEAAAFTHVLNRLLEQRARLHSK